MSIAQLVKIMYPRPKGQMFESLPLHVVELKIMIITINKTWLISTTFLGMVVVRSNKCIIDA